LQSEYDFALRHYEVPGVSSARSGTLWIDTSFLGILESIPPLLFSAKVRYIMHDIKPATNTSAVLASALEPWVSPTFLKTTPLSSRERQTDGGDAADAYVAHCSRCEAVRGVGAFAKFLPDRIGSDQLCECGVLFRMSITSRSRVDPSSSYHT